MKPLPFAVGDAELITFIDSWVSLLEAGDYQAAYHYTQHQPDTHWTPELIRKAIEQYSDGSSDQRATVTGLSTDIVQRKEVTHWKADHSGRNSEIWYDLNINDKLSDLTATFLLQQEADGIMVYLNDIHVM